MELVLEISGDQIDGARDYQEDAFLVSFLDDEEGGSRSSSLVIMADGMGGHAAGNIASNLVVSTFNKSFTGGFGREEAPQLLRRSLEKANEALSESIKETPALDGMGCTMVTGLFTRGKGYWISVGDSHLYLFRDNQLEKKNEDHSYGGYLDRMRAQGMEVEEEPGLSRNMLMSAMTGDPVAEVDCPNTAFELRAGDRIVVCSDGLDTLSAAAISQTCSWAGSAKECVAALLKAVEEARKPRQDNTTVIVVDVHSGENGNKVAPAQPAAQGDDDDTTELSFQELESALKEAPPPPAMREADLLPPPRPPKSNTGLIIGLVAALLLVVGGVGAYFMFLQPGPDPETPVEASSGERGAPEEVSGAESTEQDSGAAMGETQTTESTETIATTEQSEGEQAAQGSGEIDPLERALRDVDNNESADQPENPSVEPAAPSESFNEFEEIADAFAGGGTGPTMIALPGGEFRMGSVGGTRRERPFRTVTVRPFAMGKYEVSIAEYRAFATATGRQVPANELIGDRAPVTNVKWDDAVAYARWLSEQTGVRYRLPSEAEWEYAARGGKRSAYWWGQDPGEGLAHCFDCKSGYDRESPVRADSFKPNQFGLHNVSGNASEWVYDCFREGYIGAPTDASVWEGGDCSKRMVRGGSFRTTSGSIRVSARAQASSNRRSDEIGFRVARELQ